LLRCTTGCHGCERLSKATEARLKQCDPVTQDQLFPWAIAILAAIICVAGNVGIASADDDARRQLKAVIKFYDQQIVDPDCRHAGYVICAFHSFVLRLYLLGALMFNANRHQRDPGRGLLFP
jgi:hypothetical protein